MMWWWNSGAGWGNWMWMALVMLPLWALVIAGLIAFFRNDGQRRAPMAPVRSDAERILDDRFARGDIDAQEYRARHEQLRSVN